MVSQVQLQVLYNAILETVANMSKNTPMAQMVAKAAHVESVYKQPTTQKTFTYYNQAKIDCQSEEEGMALSQELENDPFLPRKQKNLLLNKV